MGKVIRLDDYIRVSKEEKSDNKEKKEDSKRISVGIPNDCFCVMCGTYVPEGEQVCLMCRRRYGKQ